MDEGQGGMEPVRDDAGIVDDALEGGVIERNEDALDFHGHRQMQRMMPESNAEAVDNTPDPR